MRAIHRLLATTILLVLFSCGGDSPTSPSPPKAALSGVVHELNPPIFTRIAGAQVTIQGKSALSNAGGEFRFTDLTPGPTVLTLQKEGFRTRDQPLTLQPGENTTSQEMLPAQ